jgi:ABC-type multidrug transport system fused ATPase/permease subunit
MPQPPPLVTMRSVPWRTVYRWAWYVVGVAPIWVAVQTAMSLGVNILNQYSMQVLATATSALSSSAFGSAAPPVAGTGLIGALLPRDGATAAVLFAGLTVLLIVLAYVERIILAWTDNLMVGRLRQDIHDKVLTLGPSFHEKFGAGRATLVLTSFVMIAQLILKEVVTAPVTRLVPMIIALVFLSYNLNTIGQQDYAIQAILFVGLIVLPIIGWYLASRLQTAFARANNAQAELTEEFLNSVHRPMEIQLMSAQPQRASAFQKRVQAYIHAQVTATMRQQLAMQFQFAIPRILQAAVLLYGIFVALQSGNAAAAGAILGLYLFVPQVVQPIQELLTFIAGFTSSWPQVQSVIDVLEAKPDEADRGGRLELRADDRSLAFQSVTFAYTPDRPKILDDVSHVFEPGKVTAIVARFGTGKSTVLNIVARLRYPQTGSILIGNKPLQEIKRESLRGNVVKVSQFPLFISDTARENFRLAKADVTDAEIEAVCRTTGLWDVFVKQAPKGGNPLSYMVSREDDVGLTGGQRRIFAVSRALLLKPTVLLLDEPTTGVDPIGRHEIFQTLSKACVGLTVLVVDQDMNFVEHFADQVCCLEDAKFADVGSPKELMARPSLFARLSQASQA